MKFVEIKYKCVIFFHKYFMIVCLKTFFPPLKGCFIIFSGLNILIKIRECFGRSHC